MKRAKRIRAEIDKLMNTEATRASAEDESAATPSLRELTDAEAAAAQAQAKSKSAEHPEDHADFDRD
ncbi:MAG: hypothetical protein ABR582_13225 [Gemmatimonadaceae bacterium]